MSLLRIMKIRMVKEPRHSFLGDDDGGFLLQGNKLAEFRLPQRCWDLEIKIP